MRTHHEDEGLHDNQDFVYDESNRHLSKKPAILTDAITKEEADSLEQFILSKIPNDTEDEEPQLWTLPYRTDEWDEAGVIHKIQELAKEYIADNYHLKGAVEPKKFELVRTDHIQTYKRKYPESYINDNEILYTVIVTPMSSGSSFAWGETVYRNNGEGFRPSRTDAVIHRNEEYNNWEVQEPMNGTRLDLIITLREMNMGISYDYEMDQTAETDEEY